MPEHPIYSTIKFLAVVASVTLVLYMNASKFDKTEYLAIAEFAGVILAGKGLGYVVKKDS